MLVKVIALRFCAAQHDSGVEGRANFIPSFTMIGSPGIPIGKQETKVRADQS
jgi:hypothetical protein